MVFVFLLQDTDERNQKDQNKWRDIPLTIRSTESVKPDQNFSRIFWLIFKS